MTIMRRTRAATLLLVLVHVGCVQRGVRASGEGEVELVGTSDRSLAGPCAVTAEPAWGVGLPWVVRWRDRETDWKLELRTASRLRPGELEIALPGSDRLRVLAFLWEGMGVNGAVAGTASVTIEGDSTIVRVRGRIEHRETWDVEAVCRAGPPSAEDDARAPAGR